MISHVKRLVSVFFCVCLFQCLLSLKATLSMFLYCLNSSCFSSIMYSRIPVWIHRQLLYCKVIKCLLLVWCHWVKKSFQALIMCGLQGLASKVPDCIGMHNHSPQKFACQFVACLSGNWVSSLLLLLCPGLSWIGLHSMRS